jgi:hypothetical protein
MSYWAECWSLDRVGGAALTAGISSVCVKLSVGNATQWHVCVATPHTWVLEALAQTIATII